MTTATMMMVNYGNNEPNDCK